MFLRRVASALIKPGKQSALATTTAFSKPNFVAATLSSTWSHSRRFSAAPVQSPTGKQYDERAASLPDDEWQRKETTGLAGLAVVPDARHVLTEQYKTILEMLTVIPPKAYYRQSVEKYVRYRLGVVVSNESIREIENIINCGEIEELIDQAQDEIQLIPRMAEWKPWDSPEVDSALRDADEALFPEEKEQRLAQEAEEEARRAAAEQKAADEKK